MKITIEHDNKEINLDLKGLKGRNVKKGKKLLLALATVEDEKEQIQKVEEYGDFIDSVAVEITGLTIDELDDLFIEDKEKITSYIQQKIDDNINFVKSSSLVENSKPKTTQG